MYCSPGAKQFSFLSHNKRDKCIIMLLGFVVLRSCHLVGARESTAFGLAVLEFPLVLCGRQRKLDDLLPNVVLKSYDYHV